jgi:hypothetical protein
MILATDPLLAGASSLLAALKGLTFRR